MGCSQSKDPVVLGKSTRQNDGSKSFDRTRSMYVAKETASAKPQNDVPPDLNEKGHLTTEEVAKRTISSKSDLKFVVQKPDESDSNATEIQYAYLTQRGYYPDSVSKANQDAYSITLKLGGEDGDAMFAVYDGHGSLGHKAAEFAKVQLPKSLAKFIRQRRSQQHIAKLKEQGQSTKDAWNPKAWPLLDIDGYEDCCKKAYNETNNLMHESKNFVDKLSGTTAVSVSFHGGRMTISNVGDSRVLLGHKIQNGVILPIPLTRDQTPYRKDERERIKAAGGEVKSIDQLKGTEPIHENWGDMVHGEVVDIAGDPPRVWVKGNEFPGAAFTRSLGDSVAETVGVISDPEMVTKNLTVNDKYLVIASDGIFEFLPNKKVMEIVEQSESPVDACSAIHKAALEQWEEHENRTDDITLIVLFLSNSFTPKAGERGTTEDLVADALTYYGTPHKKVGEDDVDAACGIDLCLSSE